MESVPYGGTLIPPINFGMVETDLYRSGVPNELSFPFLEKLQLKKILYLAPDEVSQQFLNFVDDQGIELVALGWDGEKSPWKPISEEVGKDCRCEQARNNIDICVCVCLSSFRLF